MIKRIQRKRSKGYKLPPNTKCISRYSKWANPFLLENNWICLKSNVKKTPYYILLRPVPSDIKDTRKVLKELYSQLINGERTFVGITIEKDFPFEVYVPTIEEIIGLKEYDHLACWCSTEHDCHGDVLCEVINDYHEFYDEEAAAKHEAEHPEEISRLRRLIEYTAFCFKRAFTKDHYKNRSN